jgi:hypothetical protein
MKIGNELMSCHGWQHFELFSQIALTKVVCKGVFDASNECCGHANVTAVMQANVDLCDGISHVQVGMDGSFVPHAVGGGAVSIEDSMGG